MRNIDFCEWNILENKSNVDISAYSEYPEFLAKILNMRGYSPEAAAELLSGKTEFYNPFLIEGMEKAVGRILKAVNEGETILIYGDYDCDGICSTVMLYSYLEHEGAEVMYYIPDRESEGYGLNMQAVDMIINAGVNLVITVDNGISSVNEIDKLNEHNVDVVVTDHHTIPEIVPKCCAAIDLHSEESKYPYKELCGAGVVLKLITALENGAAYEVMEEYGDLAAIATVADVVELKDENRSIVIEGLKRLAAAERPGLRALMEIAGINYDEGVTSEQVAFMLAPRINATGRVGSVDDAVELLLSEDEARCKYLANNLNNMNAQRKDMETEILAEAEDILRNDSSLTASDVITVCGNNWHTGVIGIIAARLLEKYKKPTIVFTKTEDGSIRGSARSVEGFSIIEAITSTKELLTKFGGHPMAAGLSMESENYDKFREKLKNFCREKYEVMPYKKINVDCSLALSEVTVENIQKLSGLEPFGHCNTQPVFAVNGVTITQRRALSGGNHVKLTVTDGNCSADVLCFGTKAAEFPMEVGSKVNIAATLSINNFKEVLSPTIKALSVVPCGFNAKEKFSELGKYHRIICGVDADISEFTPFTRNDLAVVYKYLRENSPYSYGVDWLSFKLRDSIPYYKAVWAVDILCDLKLAEKQSEGKSEIIKVLHAAQKADIKTAKTYKLLSTYGMAV